MGPLASQILLIFLRHLRNGIDSAISQLQMHTASFPLQPKNIFQSVIRIPGFTPTKEKRALWKANKTQVPHSTPVSQFPSAHPPPNSPLKNRLVKSLAFCSGLSDGGFSIFFIHGTARHVFLSSKLFGYFFLC